MLCSLNCWNSLTNIQVFKGGGIAQWLALLPPDPTAPGFNPGTAENFFLYCLVSRQYSDQTHPVFKQGISQMQLSVKARVKYCKKEYKYLKDRPQVYWKFAG